MPTTEPTNENLAIAVLRSDGGTQMRSGIDDAKLREYSEIVETALKEAESECPPGGNLLDHFRHPFPPVGVVYDGTHYWMWDGAHRRAAYVANNIPVINSEVIPGTRRDAVFKATGANKHGLPHSTADKRRAVIVLLEDPEWMLMSNYEIARHSGASEKTVRNIRKELTKVTHAEGARGAYDKLSDTGAESAYGLTPALRAELEQYAPDTLEAVRNGEITASQAKIVLTQRKAKEGVAVDEEVAPVKPEVSKPEPAATVEYMTDEEWLNTIPAYVYLREKNHKGVAIREDALTYRVMQNAKSLSGFRYAVAQNVDLRDGGDTPFTRVLVEVALMPDPQRWKVCGGCGGDGCERCNYTGYSLHTGKEV